MSLLDQLEPLRHAWHTVESNALLKVVLDAIIIEMAMTWVSGSSKFMKLDKKARTAMKPAKKIAWHALHLANIAALFTMFILLIAGLITFARTALSFGLFAFLLAFFTVSTPQKIEDYVALL